MAEKIKLMHIIPNLRCGGAERVCFDLLINISRDKYDLSLILFKDTEEGNNFKEQLINKGVEIISLKKRYLIDLNNFYQIYKAIKKIKPAILHTHLGGDIYGRLAGFLSRVPIIVSTEHNLNISERKSATFLKKLTAPWAKQIFPVSEAVKNDAIKRYNLKANKLTVIYNGIDLNNFKKEVTNIEPKKNRKVIIGGLGRLTKQKGFSVLIDAAHKLKNKNWQIIIGGAGPLKAELIKQITDLNLSNQVQLLGPVEPVSFFKNIDIFVVPSLWEGLGLVALEAAAMNKITIASNIDGLKEVVNEKTGFLFKVKDSEDLANKIDEVIAKLNSEEIDQKIKLANEIIKEKFSLEKMTENYSDWYEKLYNKSATN